MTCYFRWPWHLPWPWHSLRPCVHFPYFIPSILQSFQEIHPSSLVHSEQNTPHWSWFVRDRQYISILFDANIQSTDVRNNWSLSSYAKWQKHATNNKGNELQNEFKDRAIYEGGLLVQFKCDWCCGLICLNLISCEFLFFTRGVIIDILVFY